MAAFSAKIRRRLRVPSSRSCGIEIARFWASMATWNAGEGRYEMARLVEDLETVLSRAGVGTISEIFDAEAPFLPRGCIAQAWSVAETLRAWLLHQGRREAVAGALFVHPQTVRYRLNRSGDRQLNRALRKVPTVVPDIPVIHRPVTENFASATRIEGAWSSSDRGGRPSLSGGASLLREEGTEEPISAGRQCRSPSGDLRGQPGRMAAPRC